MTLQTNMKELVDRGLNKEDMSLIFNDMFSYHMKVRRLIDNVLNDTSSSLRSKTNLPVLGTGSDRPKVMIVSDKPTDYESEHQRAGFTDYAMYMMLFFKKLDLSMSDLYFTLAVKYKTDKMNMTYIKEGYPVLKEEITVLMPDVIITLGDTAISALANEKLRVQDANDGEGCVFEVPGPFADIPVIPLIHPKRFLGEDKETLKKHTQDMWKQIKVIKSYL